MAIETVFFGSEMHGKEWAKLATSMGDHFVSPVLIFPWEGVGRIEVYSWLSRASNPMWGWLFAKPGTLADYLLLVAENRSLNVRGHHGGTSGGVFHELIVITENACKYLNPDSEHLDECILIGEDMLGGLGDIDMPNILNGLDQETFIRRINELLMPYLIRKRSQKPTSITREPLTLEVLMRGVTENRLSTSDLGVMLTTGSYGSPGSLKNHNYLCSLNGATASPISYRQLIQLVGDWYKNHPDQDCIPYGSPFELLSAIAPMEPTDFPIAVLLETDDKASRLEIFPAGWNRRNGQWVQCYPGNKLGSYICDAMPGGQPDPWPFIAFDVAKFP